MPISSLTCFKCGRNSIPAPEGTTEKTRYICKECSPVAPALVELDFDQMHNGLMHPARARHAARRVASLTGEALNQVLRLKPDYLRAARERGERWLLGASAENIRRLPERRRVCLIMTVWGGLSSAEAGEIIGVNAQSVRNAVMLAKKDLLAMRLGTYHGNAKATHLGPRQKVLQMFAGYQQASVQIQ